MVQNILPVGFQQLSVVTIALAVGCPVHAVVRNALAVGCPQLYVLIVSAKHQVKYAMTSFTTQQLTPSTHLTH